MTGSHHMKAQRSRGLQWTALLSLTVPVSLIYAYIAIGGAVAAIFTDSPPAARLVVVIAAVSAFATFICTLVVLRLYPGTPSSGRLAFVGRMTLVMAAFDLIAVPTLFFLLGG